MANSLADFMSDPNLGGSTPGNSLIPMVRGNFGGSPDELEKIRQFAMSLPDPQQRNQLLAALQNNVNPMEQGPQMPPVPQPNQGELTRRQGGMFNYDANTGSFNPGGNVSRSDGQNYNLGPQQATPSDMAKAALMEKLRGTQNVPAEDFNSSVLDALYDPATGTFRSGGAVRDNQTGKVTALGGGAPRQQGPVISYGVGNGGITQLKDSGGMPEADYSRVQVTIPGLGKGHYSTDGAYVVGEYDNGVRWKALLGYDHAATQANQANSLAMQKMQLGNVKTQEEINELRQKMSAPAAGPSAPAGYRWTKDGARLEAIPGGPAAEGKATTEDEKKAAGYAIRMDLALKQMDELGKLEASAVKPQIGASIASGIPLIGAPLANTLNTSVRRRIEASQLDALDAALTLATGAAYTKEQLQNLSKSYFPQIGDEPKDVQDKKDRLNSIVETARIRSGRAAPSIDQAVNAHQARIATRDGQPATGSPATPQVNPAQAIFEAKKKIQGGGDPVWIIRKLESMGITNHGINPNGQ